MVVKGYDRLLIIGCYINRLALSLSPPPLPLSLSPLSPSLPIQEVSLVQGLPRFANYIARERTELIVLDKEATVKLLAAGINKELSLKVQHIK